jgi:hypothetical protein
MRVHFNDLFTAEDGYIIPKHPTNLFNAKTVLAGTKLQGNSFNGVVLEKHTNSQFEVEDREGVKVIRRVY